MKPYQNHHLDEPSIVDDNGNKFWYQDGKLHRLGAPAFETVDGYKAGIRMVCYIDLMDLRLN